VSDLRRWQARRRRAATFFDKCFDHSRKDCAEEPMRYSERFRVQAGGKLDLGKVDPGFTDKQVDKSSAAGELEAHTQKLRELQYMLYAENRRSLLICLQGLDAAGKDGTITHVLGAMNPQGTRVHGFKVPSREEAAHDFLWRAHQHAPATGEVVIFNRSHYESVLVERVHRMVPAPVWRERYELIRAFERGLLANGTHILKFFIHISPGEQLRRFKQRLDDPARHWKISESDYRERELWPRYIEAFEEAIANTSTDEAPWFVIPADHKWFRNLAISEIVVDTLSGLHLTLPAPTVDIAEIRRRYHDAESKR
jgi:PPK2 family polyphosphate:nucleotide phosphotransferase